MKPLFVMLVVVVLTVILIDIDAASQTWGEFSHNRFKLLYMIVSKKKSMIGIGTTDDTYKFPERVRQYQLLL